MSHLKSNLTLFAILLIVLFLALGISQYLLYQTALEQERGRLVETVQSQARLIEAVASFAERHSQNAIEGGSEAATLSQLRDAHSKYPGFGRTGEFTLARLQGQNIHFLFHRQEINQDTATGIKMGSELAVPMQLALSGQSGTVIASDYRGIQVLAAYEPIRVLNYGIVAKINLAEIREPFWQSSMIGLLVALLLSGPAAFGFNQVMRPMWQELHNREEKYRLAVTATRDSLWDWDIASGRVEYSPNWAKMLGEDQVANEYSSWEERIHEDDREFVIASLQAHLDGRQATWKAEHRLRQRDGRWKWVLGRGEIIERDSVGRPLRMIGTMTDIHQRKEIEGAFHHAQEHINLLLDSTAEAIYGLDLKGCCTFVNTACLDMLGYRNEEELLGKNMHHLIHHSHADGTAMAEPDCRIYKAIHSNQKIHTDNEVFWRKDGSSFPVEYWSYPVLKEGKLMGAVVTFLDVTTRAENRKQLAMYRNHLEEMVATRTRQLEHARKRAESANRAKSEFLSNMSHEIRTPMNHIIGLTHLALQQQLSEQAGAYITKANTSAENLLRIINDILDFSRIESGMLSLEIAPFSLDQVFHDLNNVLTLPIQEKNIEFGIEVDQDVPDLLQGDALRVGQVLTNLTGNAVKFTPPNGRITLSVKIRNQRQDGITLMFTLRDTGIGMTVEEQEKLFRAFSQADSSTTRNYGGTGLGLVISQRLVEMMDGRIWLVSEKGVGSTFSFYLPFTLPAEDGEEAINGKGYSDAEVALAGQRLKGKQLLLVEDNDINQELVQELLQEQEVSLDIADNGQQALERVNEKDYDALLMDCQMPVMDGFEATRRIREQLGSDLPIVALTANVLPEDRQRVIDSGMNDFVGKPIDPDELLVVLGRWVGDGTHSS